MLILIWIGYTFGTNFLYLCDNYLQTKEKNNEDHMAELHAYHGD